jgi:hypothetical protein
MSTKFTFCSTAYSALRNARRGRQIISSSYTDASSMGLQAAKQPVPFPCAEFSVGVGTSYQRQTCPNFSQFGHGLRSLDTIQVGKPRNAQNRAIWRPRLAFRKAL